MCLKNATCFLSLPKHLLKISRDSLIRVPGRRVATSARWTSCRAATWAPPAARTGASFTRATAAAAAGPAITETMKEEGAADQDGAAWNSLGTSRDELQLEWTLPTGQSFRWRQTSNEPLEFTGVVGQRAVRLRQLDNDVQYQVIARGSTAPPAGDAAALHDYFNLGTPLAELVPGWCAACPRYAHVHRHLPGARMLRQDPVECLFSFICSQNNHIQRIHGMVERLCRQHGTPLLPSSLEAFSGNGATGATAAQQADLALHAFPTLEQLAAATEEELRADGFGYRAKYITGSTAALLAKPGGGAAWLLGLRSVPYEEAAEALCTLPGIGPKVAACICLFSLDKHAAIPVDTHVWALACKYYTPHLRNKSLTKKIHGEVQAAFVKRFGPYAGWAHNTLFIAELAATRDKVPAVGAGSKRVADASGSDSDYSDAEEAASSGSSAKGRRRVKQVGAMQVEAAAPAADAGAAPNTPAGEDVLVPDAAAPSGAPKRPRRRAAKRVPVDSD